MTTSSKSLFEVKTPSKEPKTFSTESEKNKYLQDLKSKKVSPIEVFCSKTGVAYSLKILPGGKNYVSKRFAKK